ncbi:MAG: copper resistance protein NlpE [Pseudoxanthomonas suwonensis]|nr:copper resistance protein NlpE [Pseudoxanthomonas suwonensis]
MKPSIRIPALMAVSLLCVACTPPPASPEQAGSVATGDASPLQDTPSPVQEAAPPGRETMTGQFSGTLPCASCPGIDTRLTLSADGSFLLEETYQEQADGRFRMQGKWSMDDRGHLTLAPPDSADAPRVYRVDDANTLRQIGEGDVDPGDAYTLRRD